MDGINKTLELETRRQIYNFIQKHPGMHEREISRKLNLPLSTLDYHLYYLKKRELIVVIKKGNYAQYFIKDSIGAKDKKTISILRKKPCRKIIIFLLLNSNSNHKNLKKHLGLAASTTSFHLNNLINQEIIEYSQIGRETKYHIKEPDYLSDLIITYKKSFLDDAVDRFIETWFEMNPKHLHKK